MRFKSLVIASLLLAPGFAMADDAWAPPVEIIKSIHADTPYGSGSLNYMMLPVYDAALWTDAVQWSWDEPFALSLRYSMDFAATDIVQRSIDEMQHVGPMTESEYLRSRAELARVIPDVQRGDVITAIYRPNHDLRFYHNSLLTGAMQDDALAQHFLSIWLSSSTSAPDLRRQLLKLSEP